MSASPLSGDARSISSLDPGQHSRNSQDFSATLGPPSSEDGSIIIPSSVTAPGVGTYGGGPAVKSDHRCWRGCQAVGAQARCSSLWHYGNIDPALMLDDMANGKVIASAQAMTETSVSAVGVAPCSNSLQTDEAGAGAGPANGSHFAEVITDRGIEQITPTDYASHEQGLDAHAQRRDQTLYDRLRTQRGLRQEITRRKETGNEARVRDMAKHYLSKAYRASQNGPYLPR